MDNFPPRSVYLSIIAKSMENFKQFGGFFPKGARGIFMDNAAFGVDSSRLSTPQILLSETVAEQYFEKGGVVHTFFHNVETIRFVFSHSVDKRKSL